MKQNHNEKKSEKYKKNKDGGGKGTRTNKNIYKYIKRDVKK